jgi:hypothetical protein
VTIAERFIAGTRGPRNRPQVLKGRPKSEIADALFQSSLWDSFVVRWCDDTGDKSPAYCQESLRDTTKRAKVSVNALDERVIFPAKFNAWQNRMRLKPWAKSLRTCSTIVFRTDPGRGTGAPGLRRLVMLWVYRDIQQRSPCSRERPWPTSDATL